MQRWKGEGSSMRTPGGKTKRQASVTTDMTLIKSVIALKELERVAEATATAGKLKQLKLVSPMEKQEVPLI